MTLGDQRPASGTSTCPGCGLTAPDTGDAPPAEYVASGACWRLYGELLARGYGDPGSRRVHQMVVDAYAAQHAGGTSRREVQTVALCLMTLCLFLEGGLDPADGPRLHKQMIRDRPPFHWLQPPPQQHLLTVADVLAAQDPAEHERFVRRWAGQVWQAWAPHHATIGRWNRQALA